MRSSFIHLGSLVTFWEFGHFFVGQDLFPVGVIMHDNTPVFWPSATKSGRPYGVMSVSSSWGTPRRRSV